MITLCLIWSSRYGHGRDKALERISFGEAPRLPIGTLENKQIFLWSIRDSRPVFKWESTVEKAFLAGQPFTAWRLTTNQSSLIFRSSQMKCPSSLLPQPPRFPKFQWLKLFTRYSHVHHMLSVVASLLRRCKKTTHMFMRIVLNIPRAITIQRIQFLAKFRTGIPSKTRGSLPKWAFFLEDVGFFNRELHFLWCYSISLGGMLWSRLNHSCWN